MLVFIKVYTIFLTKCHIREALPIFTHFTKLFIYRQYFGIFNISYATVNVGRLGSDNVFLIKYEHIQLTVEHAWPRACPLTDIYFSFGRILQQIIRGPLL